uniref:Reverse transcriptase zinc-binding domain-containing protein n=1 Tax=Micrurus corallinus TaxID=54390 RepID=A0A2D4G4D1_MICCO
MIAWGRIIGHNITLIEWENLWNRNNKVTISAAYKENAYKMFHRWHLPPWRLARVYPNRSLNCWKCKKKEGTYCHMWWSCKEPQKYWLRIKNWLEEITKEQIELKPELFLLGISRKKTWGKS